MVGLRSRLVLLLQSAGGLTGIKSDFHDNLSWPELIWKSILNLRLAAEIWQTVPVVKKQQLENKTLFVSVVI